MEDQRGDVERGSEAVKKSADLRSGAFALRIEFVAGSDSNAQAAQGRGLGLAQVQQALLFTSRYLRQGIAQKGS